MPELEGWSRKALLAELVEKLLANGSWCGETHIQKCVYFLEDLHNVPVGFEFVLYKHGPYSFDLHDELIEMKANGLLVTEPRNPYGPTLNLSDLGTQLLDRRRKTGPTYCQSIDEVAEQFGNASASDLERLATALFITARRQAAPDERAEVLNRLKPHIPLGDAKDAVAKVDRMLAVDIDAPKEPQ